MRQTRRTYRTMSGILRHQIHAPARRMPRRTATETACSTAGKPTCEPIPWMATPILSDSEEVNCDTDPCDPDSDNDGLSDYREI